jgi:hypothetical protein
MFNEITVAQLSQRLLRQLAHAFPGIAYLSPTPSWVSRASHQISAAPARDDLLLGRDGPALFPPWSDCCAVTMATEDDAHDYSADPTAGRQRLKRFSTRVIASVPIMPVSANMSTPTKTLSVWKVAPATVIIKPMPAVAA